MVFAREHASGGAPSWAPQTCMQLRQLAGLGALQWALTGKDSWAAADGGIFGHRHGLPAAQGRQQDTPVSGVAKTSQVSQAVPVTVSSDLNITVALAPAAVP